MWKGEPLIAEVWSSDALPSSSLLHYKLFHQMMNFLLSKIDAYAFNTLEEWYADSLFGNYFTKGVVKLSW